MKIVKVGRPLLTRLWHHLTHRQPISDQHLGGWFRSKNWAHREPDGRTTQPTRLADPTAGMVARQLRAAWTWWPGSCGGACVLLEQGRLASLYSAATRRMDGQSAELSAYRAGYGWQRGPRAHELMHLRIADSRFVRVGWPWQVRTAAPWPCSHAALCAHACISACIGVCIGRAKNRFFGIGSRRGSDRTTTVDAWMRGRGPRASLWPFAARPTPRSARQRGRLSSPCVQREW